jgi:6-phosphogluconolactonase
MTIIRRCFFSLLFYFLATFPAVSQTPAQKFLAFVGTYTDKTDSKGIYAFDFDSSSGRLTPRGLATEAPNPSWVVIHPNGKWAYAANESGKQSAISAFSIDAGSAKLTLLNKLPAAGEDPCYLSFDKTGKYLFVANYTSGNVVVFPILPDGKLGEHTFVVKDAGTVGPNKERQEGPHAHWIESSPDNRFVFVADLGLDRILSYRFDATKGMLTPNKPFFRPLAAGAGPRHAALSPAGDYFYVLSEINSTVTTFAYARDHGVFGYLGVVPMLPINFEGRNEAAEIAIHPSGKWLFASNRGKDSIAVFSIAPATGKLKAAGEYVTGGKEPRHFAIDPSGRFVLAENQNSNSIVVFRINPETGALSQVSTTEGVPSPVCAVFYPAR